MKKLLFLIAAMLYCNHAFSQKAELTVIPRLDLVPQVPINNKGNSDFYYGNSSLYTLLDGELGEHFSYSAQLHWMSRDTKYLYENTGYSNATNWLDWANITYSTGNWSFTLGKDYLAWGTYEEEAYDFDSYFELSSYFWNMFPGYEWAAKVGYTLPSETTTFEFQFATSPFGERFFSSKLYAYSLRWLGEYGNFKPIWSAHLMEIEKGKYLSLIALGNKWTVGKFDYVFDLTNMAVGTGHFLNQSMNVTGWVQYNMPRCEVFAKMGYAFRHESDDWLGDGDEYSFEKDIVPTGLDSGKDYVFGGIGMHYYPIKNNKDLRLHSVVAANNYCDNMAVNIGATYFFRILK